MPMKSKPRTLPSLLAIMAAAAFLTACSSSSTSSAPAMSAGASVMPPACTKAGPVVFAVSGRQHSPAPVLTADMGTALQVAVAQKSAIGLVDVDGAPKLVAAGSAGTQKMNQLAAQAYEARFAAAVARGIRGIRAVSPHADVLDALDVAGRAIRSACPHGGTIFLEDSGLQDVKPLDFTVPGQLEALPSEVVSFLSKEDEIPDLSGITVVLVGVGDTAAPQRQPVLGQRAHLQAIWSAVIKAGGGRTQVDRAPHQGAAPRGVPPVSLVTLPQLPTWPGKPSFALPDTGPVGFQPNVAEFRNPAAAQSALSGIARYLLDNPHTRIELTGTTARWGGDQWDKTLSARRAEAVKVALISLGVSPEQVVARGDGWHSPCYESDGGPNGPILEPRAQHNRSVIVTILPNKVVC
jgi:OmpA-OmpF porin, OOP family